MYTTNIQPKSEVRGSLLLINPEPKGEGFINGKLPMTEDKGRIFVAYTIMAVVHMIYDEVILVLSMVYCNYVLRWP